MISLLEGYPVIVEIPVAWGEMDAFQHVNNIYYFRYFEGARIAYFEKIRITEKMHETGIGPILGSTSCRYRYPITFPDTVSVGAKITDIGQDRFTMQYAVVSNRHQKIAAEGDAVIVLFDYRANKKTNLPPELRYRMLAIEKREHG